MSTDVPRDSRNEDLTAGQLVGTSTGWVGIIKDFSQAADGKWLANITYTDSDHNPPSKVGVIDKYEATSLTDFAMFEEQYEFQKRHQADFDIYKQAKVKKYSGPEILGWDEWGDAIYADPPEKTVEPSPFAVSEGMGGLEGTMVDNDPLSTFFPSPLISIDPSTIQPDTPKKPKKPKKPKTPKTHDLPEGWDMTMGGEGVFNYWSPDGEYFRATDYDGIEKKSISLG